VKRGEYICWHRGGDRKNWVEDAAGGFPSFGDTCRQDTAQSAAHMAEVKQFQ